MSLYNALAKDQHFGEFANPLNVKGNILTPTQRRNTALQNLTGVSTIEAADFSDFGKRIGTQATPETATDTASLTDAQMLSGILVATPTAAAAYTLRTGAQFEAAIAALGHNLANDDTIDLTIINLGGTGDDITVTAPASGITLVGDAVVRSTADSGTEQAGQGTFRFRRTAANTFVAYRVS